MQQKWHIVFAQPFYHKRDLIKDQFLSKAGLNSTFSFT